MPRLLSGVPSSSTAASAGKSYSYYSGGGSGSLYPGRDRHSFKEKRHRNSRSRLARVLQHFLFGYKKGRRLKANPKPKAPEQVYAICKVQDGDGRLYHQPLKERGMAGKLGPPRRLHACSNLASPQAVPQVRFQRYSLSVQSPSIRTNNGTQGLHESPSPSGVSYSQARGSLSPLPG